MHRYRLLPLRIAMAMLACGPAAAFADDDRAEAPSSPAPDPATAQSLPAAAHPATAPAHSGAGPGAMLGDGTPVDLERLAAMRGGEDTHESNVAVDGSVHDNTADHVVSGSNFIGDDAFANASGLNTVIQNSGSNVLIQNGMSIQVIFADPGP
ncbi:hypothetical protein [Pseudoxanthomonas sp. 10H]|uniref:hypothetical protein n=1 Tax=Pseudoxanthomonas sp. 10H TaxID=3242729 RepID=UPI0035584077